MEIEEQLAHHVVSLSLCFVPVRALHPFCTCCCILRSLRQVSAASHSQVRRPGKLGMVWRVFQNLAQSQEGQKAIVKCFFIKSGQLIYRDTQITYRAV